MRKIIAKIFPLSISDVTLIHYIPCNAEYWYSGMWLHKKLQYTIWCDYISKIKWISTFFLSFTLSNLIPSHFIPKIHSIKMQWRYLNIVTYRNSMQAQQICEYCKNIVNEWFRNWASDGKRVSRGIYNYYIRHIRVLLYYFQS